MASSVNHVVRKVNQFNKSYLNEKSYFKEEALATHKKGESIQLTWFLQSGKAVDFSELIRQLWEYNYDTWCPKPVDTPFSDDFVKETMTDFFTQSFVDDHPLKFNSGEAMVVATCESVGRAEIGFVGRVLLNAFNALEYGQQHNRPELVSNSYAVFNSYLEHGFTSNGLFHEFVNFDDNRNKSNAVTLSIRRQSEGLYAMFHFLQYEKDNGRKHPE